jgi:molecular chaperone IbpA
MTTFDPAPLWRSTIGFDRLFDLLNASRQWTTEDNYPPYNIERTSENRYEISLAGRARDRFVTISSYLDF